MGYAMILCTILSLLVGILVYIKVAFKHLILITIKLYNIIKAKYKNRRRNNKYEENSSSSSSDSEAEDKVNSPKQSL